jgi:hypothetical protein
MVIPSMIAMMSQTIALAEFNRRRCLRVFTDR